MAADGTCWQVAFGILCSSRDDQARYPHLRVALATGVCGSQQASAAFEIAVVKCMMLCVRSLRKMLARKHVHIFLERSRMVSNHLIQSYSDRLRSRECIGASWLAVFAFTNLPRSPPFTYVQLDVTCKHCHTKA